MVSELFDSQGHKTMKTLSCQEVYERMDNGLCLFCEELDSPGHYHLKHKRVQIFMAVDEDDQLSDDNKLDPVDLKQGDYHAKTIAEEKLNPPLGQNIEHLESKLAQMDSEKSVSHDLIPHAQVHGSSPVWPIILSMPSVSPQPPDPPDRNRSNMISAIIEPGSEPDKENDDPNPDCGNGFMQDAVSFEEDVVNLRVRTEEESVVDEKLLFGAYDGFVASDQEVALAKTMTEEKFNPLEQNIDHLGNKHSPKVSVDSESHRSVMELNKRSEPDALHDKDEYEFVHNKLHETGLPMNLQKNPGPLIELSYSKWGTVCDDKLSLIPADQSCDDKGLIEFVVEEKGIKPTWKSSSLFVKESCRSENYVAEIFEKLAKSWKFKFKDGSRKNKLTDLEFPHHGEVMKLRSKPQGTCLQKTLEMFSQPVNEKVSLEVHYVLDLEAYIGLEIYDCKYKEQMLVLVKQCYRVWDCGGFLATSVSWKLLEKWYKGDSVLNTRSRLFCFAVDGIVRFEGLQNYCLEVLTSKGASLVELKKILWGGSNIGEGTTELEIYILACHSGRNQKPCGTYTCLEVTDLSWLKRHQKTSCFLLKVSFVVWNMAYKKLSKLSDKMTTCFGGNEIKTEAILKEQKEEWLITKDEVNNFQGETMERLLKANETLDYLGRVKKLITDVRFDLVSSKEALVFSRELRQFIVTMVTKGSSLLLLRKVSFSLEAQHEAGKVDKPEYNFIEKVVKSIIFTVTGEYKDIEADLVLLGMGLNEDAHRVSCFVNGYEDEDLMKVSAASFPSTSLKLLYGSLPRLPDFRTFKKSLERLSMHEKDHKLLFPKNHKPLHLRAGFWTMFNDVEQLSTKLQTSPGLNYFTHLIFLWNQALNCGCEVDHISSGIFSVVGVHEFDTCSKLQIGNETQDQRLLFLTEISLLDNTNEADLVVKENWFHNNPTIDVLFHLLRPPELLKLHGYPPPFFTTYSELSSLRTRMLSTREYCDRNYGYNDKPISILV